ncbi:MAG: RecB-like helicase [Arcobacteraceae bacterium]
MKKYLALKASAGSGKTFALTVRYIGLLLLDAKPNEILTLTFTNKAANEMSERIYHTLLNLGNDEAYLNAIIEQSKLSKEAILSAKQNLIWKFVNSELSIFTIDKFINKILREFCGYVNLNDDFTIKQDNVDELTLKFLESLSLKEFDSFVDFFLYENKKFNSVFDLFKVLIEKNETFELLPIDKELIALQEEAILQKAFKIKEFVQNAKDASASALKSVEFENFQGLLEKGKTWLTKESASEFSYFKKFANETLEAYFSDLLFELKRYYKLRSNYSLNNLLQLFLTFVNFRSNYIKTKNYLEFNDISNLVFELLQEKIDKEFLYFRLDSQYSHLLIDEFQDTSLLQYKILEPIIQEITSGLGTQFKTFFYVGDTKQSIYRFRGGKRELFDYVAQTNTLIDVEALHTNYRSSQNIVEFVNTVFLNLPNYEYYEQLYVKKEGYVEIVEEEWQDEEKFHTIFKKIEALLQAGVNQNDMAILTYTNDDVLSLYTYLQAKLPKIKISTEMTSKLVNQANVKAVINAIKYLYFQEDIYKINCNAILGSALFTSLELEREILFDTMPELIHKVATFLNVLDENVISLIEVASSYKHIVDFMYEIDFLDTPMQNKEQLGIQILTIFKSKGLEFDTVLLLDRIKRKNSDKSSLLFEYENVNLKNIYYKTPNLENFDEHYKSALEKEKRLSLEDEINILYVALTRAKHNLIVFKKAKNSVFDSLNLKPHIQGILYVKKGVVHDNIILEPISYTPLNLGRQEQKISQYKHENNYSLHSKYFGLATHYCLEMMNTFDTQSLEYALNLSKSKYNNYLESKDFEDIKIRIALLIQNSHFQSLLNQTHMVKEQALMYKNEIKIIDLLVYGQNSCYIFDYKTTQDELDEHLFQVRHYKKAIKDILKQQEVLGYIVYLKSDGVSIKEV